jgi:DNA repair exonuclease SbcCD ATPase subunit
MGPMEKIKVMERRIDEMMMAMAVKAKEFDVLTEKLAGNADELERLKERLSEHVKKIAQWIINFPTGRWSSSTSTIQQQQQEEEVDLQKEEAVLTAEFAANKREWGELTAAWNAKREEFEELSKEQKMLLNMVQLYLLPI